jgi:hypothetical protein
MYKSLAAWIKQTFSQNDPIADRNEITPDEINQLMALNRILEPTRVLRLSNSGDTTFDVDDDTAQVTIEMRDITGDRQTYGYGYRYWFHPDNFDVLVNDVVIEEHNYVFYPVSLDLEFISPVATGATVTIRGHVLNERDLMKAVAEQWLMKVGMLVDVTGAEFDRLQRRFNQVINKLYGPHMHRRAH